MAKIHTKTTAAHPAPFRWAVINKSFITRESLLTLMSGPVLSTLANNPPYNEVANLIEQRESDGYASRSHQGLSTHPHANCSYDERRFTAPTVDIQNSWNGCYEHDDAHNT